MVVHSGERACGKSEPRWAIGLSPRSATTSRRPARDTRLDGFGDQLPGTVSGRVRGVKEKMRKLARAAAGRPSGCYSASIARHRPRAGSQSAERRRAVALGRLFRAEGVDDEGTGRCVRLIVHPRRVAAGVPRGAGSAPGRGLGQAAGAQRRHALRRAARSSRPTCCATTTRSSPRSSTRSWRRKARR